MSDLLRIVELVQLRAAALAQVEAIRAAEGTKQEKFDALDAVVKTVEEKAAEINRKYSK